MLVLYILLVVIIGIVLYVFIAPFYIEIDSTREIYRLRFHKIAFANFRITESSLLLEIKFLWFRKQIDLLQQRSRYEPAKPRTKRKRKRGRVPWKKIKSVLKSFKFNQCRISIDTGDDETNGMLFPVLYMVKFYSGREVSINFINRNIVQLQIQNSIARMSWAYLKG